jgi:penicillin-binding protein 1A
MRHSERKPGESTGSASKSLMSKWPLSMIVLLIRGFCWCVGLIASGTIVVLLAVGIALAVAYPNLPDITGLSDYRPKLPLRIYSADGVLLGEFGEERRDFTPIAEIPRYVRSAVLAIEDARFYEHGGVDYKGIARATLAPVSYTHLTLPTT